MVKRIVISIVFIIAWLFFATLFYKTICVMLLFAVWRKPLLGKLSENNQKWANRGVWLALIIILWIAMPRYRIHSGDRTRLVYVDKKGEVKHPPISHWLLSTLIPEEEVVNVGIKGIAITSPIIHMMGLGNSLINQAKNDIVAGKMGNFFEPYKCLGLENPISGVYPQLFNQCLGTNNKTFYVCEPKHYDNDKTYPLVVFCHGYLGNWQLYQGLWKGLKGAVVASIGTRDLSGIFGQSDINSIFEFYIPMLERMGYKIDHSQVHLMGLSNGGTAIIAAMHSSHSKDFKSITTISCNLEGLRKVPCQVNLIGGGKDNSSKRMPSQYRELKRMGVDVALYFNEDDNHFIMVNHREAILDFLNGRFNCQIEE